MPRIYDFILCKSCENSPETGSSAIQIFGAFRVNSLPERISFSALTSIYGLEIGNAHIEIKLRDPKGVEVAKATGNLEYQGSGIIPYDFAGLNINADFKNIEITTTGIYSLEILVGETSLGKKEFCIYGIEDNKEMNDE